MQCAFDKRANTWVSGTESPEIVPHTYSQLTSAKGNLTEKGYSFQQMVLE